MSEQLSFDQKCYDLADHFLSDEWQLSLHTDGAKRHLAAIIQEAIEDEIKEMRKTAREAAK